MRLHLRSLKTLLVLGAILSLLLGLAACAGEGAVDDPDSDDPATGADADAESDADVESDADAFWAGKELEFMIPTSPGGGTNRQARFFASLLPDFLPGNPDIQPQNYPGAGGSVGGNIFAHQRDHTEPEAIFISSGSSFMPWMFGNPQMLLNYNDLVGLISIPAAGAVYVNPQETGIESPEDFAEMAQDIDWVIGAQAPDGADLPELLAFDLLGLTNQAVMGFEGSGPQRLAYEQGDLLANGDPSGSWGEVQPLIDQGLAVPVFSYGALEGGDLVHDPLFPDIPHFFEMYEMIHGEPLEGMQREAYTQVVSAAFALQKMVWVHQDAPEEAIETLQQAFIDMKGSPEFEEGKEEAIGEGIEVLVGADATAAGQEMTAGMSPEALDWVIEYMVENHGYEDTRL